MKLLFTVFGIYSFFLPGCLAQVTQSGVGNVHHIQTRANPQGQAEAAEEVIKRLFPERYSEFVLRVDPSLTNSPHRDAFEIHWNTDLNKTVITGTTGVAGLFGFNFYLKYYCNCHVAWEGKQLNLPQTLPKVNLRQEIYDRFRYYQNACTDSYSFVWWDWKKWEEHIDWMALSGINLPLAFTGQEAIWLKVFTDMGLDPKDILQEYIAGPAFLAWWRMGNMQKWGGPIPQLFLQSKLELLKRIVVRMRSLGMIPVLPAFAGNIPKSFASKFPNASVAQHGAWSSFNDSYTRNYFLLPGDPLFLEVGTRFIKELTDTIGTDHVYSCDTFNENRPMSNDSEFLHQMANATYMSMAAGDPQAVWMIQSWMFIDADFWKREQVRSYLSGVTVGNALILDLFAERLPLFDLYDSFYNHSFIWCMLHNFGGTQGLFGSLDLVNEGVPNARNGNNSFVGTGICPEGINQNYFIYEFMTEASLREAPVNVTDWSLQYQERRYGIKDMHLSAAWQLLIKQIYNAGIVAPFRGKAVTIISRPSFKLKELVWYNVNDVYKVVDHFVQFSSNRTIPPNSLIRFDMVDFMRQFLQNLGTNLYKATLGWYYTSEGAKFEEAARRMVDLFNDLDAILATNENFLLGTWVTDAEKWGNSTEEKQLMRLNALNQVTLWGPDGQIVDYAAKQWAGLMTNYYKQRWICFFKEMRTDFAGTFNYQRYFNTLFNTVEKPFTFSQQVFPTIPQGDTIQVAVKLFKKWREDHIHYAELKVNRTKQYRRRKSRRRNKNNNNNNTSSENMIRPLVK